VLRVGDDVVLVGVGGATAIFDDSATQMLALALDSMAVTS